MFGTSKLSSKLWSAKFKHHRYASGALDPTLTHSPVAETKKTRDAACVAPFPSVSRT